MVLFEFMIGNTDLSVCAQHNVRLVETPANEMLPVPYDFDFSGLVNTTYSGVDKRLGIQSVRDRLYRGPCRTPQELETFFVRIRALKTEINAVYDAIPDMASSDRREARAYLDGVLSHDRSAAGPEAHVHRPLRARGDVIVRPARQASPKRVRESGRWCSCSRRRIAADAARTFSSSPIRLFPSPCACETGRSRSGEAFSFMSGLYFRGKLTYAMAFGRPAGATTRPRC